MAVFSTAAVLGAAAIAGTAAVASSVIASNAQKKAQESAEEFAQQQAAEARVEQQRQEEVAQVEQERLEEKFELTPQELEREEEQFRLEGERGEELERRAGLPGEELLREIGPTTRQLLDTVAARQGKTGEELFREEGGDVAGLLIDQLSSGDPLAPFQGELQQAIETANQQAARRGVFSGEVGDELRGRAAVDLAIKSSRERLLQQQSLATQLFNIQAGTREEAGKLAERGLAEATGSRAELGDFLADLQTLTDRARQREQNVSLAASGQTAAARQSAAAIASQERQSAAATQQSILGLQAGQAARTQSDITGGLAGLGTTIAEKALFPATADPNSGGKLFGESRTEEESLLRLGNIVGSGNLRGALGAQRGNSFLVRP